MKIFIDAGHNYSGVGTGAIGFGLKEQTITFEIADKLRKVLVSAGHNVKMSRAKLTDNLGKTLNEGLLMRSAMANEWGADIFISIHTNAKNGKSKGTETLIYSKKSKSLPYAEAIQKAIVKNLGTVDRGVKERPDLSVLRRTSMPALLIETAFIDNKEDAVLLVENQDGFVSAIYEGLFGEKPKDSLSIKDIVQELKSLGIISDTALWEKKFAEDMNSYWLAQKALNYIKNIK